MRGRTGDSEKGGMRRERDGRKKKKAERNGTRRKGETRERRGEECEDEKTEKRKRKGGVQVRGEEPGERLRWREERKRLMVWKEERKRERWVGVAEQVEK